VVVLHLLHWVVLEVVADHVMGVEIDHSVCKYTAVLLEHLGMWHAHGCVGVSLVDCLCPSLLLIVLPQGPHRL
jgi:hypothetical protein